MEPLRTKQPAARSVGTAIVICFLLAFGLQAGFAYATEMPVPEVHDEFAYLLNGDTFASGRLTNPPHPHWVHFDTIHVLQHPTYQAKYQPAQGLFLALGQVTSGHPAVGVWLGMAAACAATTWMLASLVPLLWALFGPLVFLLHVPVLNHWSEGYWGGGVAMLGGALFLGGLLWLSRRPSVVHAGWVGIGGWLLINSRPVEGALLAALTLPVWASHFRVWSASGARRDAIVRVGVPLAVALGLSIAWMAFYNYAVTHDALRLPYLSWDKYASPRDDVQHYAGSAERSFLGKMRYLQKFYCGSVIAFALPFLLLRRHSRSIWLAALAVGIIGLVSALTSRAWAHYIAPVAPLAIYIEIEALRALARLGVGRWIAAALIAGQILISIQVHASAIQSGTEDVWYQDRQRILEELEAKAGSHLVFVRYGPEHSIHREWIYNAADIDGARIVWARELSEAENRGLVTYYPQREVWIVETDTKPPVLRPYE